MPGLEGSRRELILKATAREHRESSYASAYSAPRYRSSRTSSDDFEDVFCDDIRYDTENCQGTTSWLSRKAPAPSKCQLLRKLGDCVEVGRPPAMGTTASLQLAASPHF